MNLFPFQQKPTRISCYRLIKSNFHWKCLLSTLLVYVCIAYGVWCHLRNAYDGSIVLHYSHGPCSQGYNFIPIAFGILLYLIYLTECWHARAKNSSIPVTDVREAQEYIQKLKEATPIVWWKSICYHYLRRSRQVTRYRNGDAVTATQIYYERVNSHTAGNVFMFDTCGYRDISKSLVEFERFPVVKLKFSKGFVFACVQAANEFEEQRTRFFNENEVRDDYMEVREGLDLVETPFVEEMIVYTNPNLRQPWYLSSTVYWICSALLLSWPLRMLGELMTAHVHYHATKLFGTNYLSPSSVNYTGPLTRTDTMESAELERAMRENYLIVPSYSEAVLLDPVNPSAFIFPSLRARIEQQSYCNENVITNYGAIRNQSSSSRPPPAFSSLFSSRSQNSSKIPPRSISMNFPGSNPRQIQNSSTANVPVPRPSQLLQKSSKIPPRSISISGICGTARSSGYHSENITPIIENMERRPLIEPMQVVGDEAPPSYEVCGNKDP